MSSSLKMGSYCSISWSGVEGAGLCSSTGSFTGELAPAPLHRSLSSKLSPISPSEEIDSTSPGDRVSKGATAISSEIQRVNSCKRKQVGIDSSFLHKVTIQRKMNKIIHRYMMHVYESLEITVVTKLQNIPP